MFKPSPLVYDSWIKDLPKASSSGKVVIGDRKTSMVRFCDMNLSLYLSLTVTNVLSQMNVGGQGSPAFKSLLCYAVTYARSFKRQQEPEAAAPAALPALDEPQPPPSLPKMVFKSNEPLLTDVPEAVMSLKKVDIVDETPTDVEEFVVPILNAEMAHLIELPNSARVYQFSISGASTFSSALVQVIILHANGSLRFSC